MVDNPTGMSTSFQEHEVRAFYAAALSGLRALERRLPTDRRFGDNADARWQSFRGDLTTADRLDLLIRDADAQWPGSFGARTAFAMRAVSEDDPFGSGWSPLDPVDAEELWRSELAKSAPKSIGDGLNAVAAAWGLKPKTAQVGPVDAAQKLLLAGPGSIIGAAAVFAEGSDLDWADQVICVATPPGHRQLAAVVAALLNSSRRCTILGAKAPQGEDKVEFGGRTLVVSDDADPADAELARRLVGEGGSDAS